MNVERASMLKALEGEIQVRDYPVTTRNSNGFQSLIHVWFYTLFLLIWNTFAFTTKHSGKRFSKLQTIHGLSWLNEIVSEMSIKKRDGRGGSGSWKIWDKKILHVTRISLTQCTHNWSIIALYTESCSKNEPSSYWKVIYFNFLIVFRT